VVAALERAVVAWAPALMLPSPIELVVIGVLVLLVFALVRRSGRGPR
jgi:hypothetical protein